jgi:hypothetical protein
MSASAPRVLIYQCPHENCGKKFSTILPCPDKCKFCNKLKQIDRNGETIVVRPTRLETLIKFTMRDWIKVNYRNRYLQ